MYLKDCPIGAEVCLLSSDFDEPTCFRLRELGLSSGVCARIVQRAPFGGRVLSIAGQRIAIDGGTARRFAVELTGIAAPVAATSMAVAPQRAAELTA